MPRKPRVLVTYVHPGGPHALSWELHSSLVRLKESSVLMKEIAAESGPLLSRARNLLAESFVKGFPDYSHMLSVDTDMYFSPEGVKALLKADKPIVGGVYYGLTETGKFCTALNRDSKDGVYKPIPDPPSKGCVEVDALGMGLTLIKREVMEALEPDYTRLWPFAEAVVDGRPLGEDATFCLRAKELGFSSWLCGDARAGHVKSFVLGG